MSTKKTKLGQRLISSLTSLHDGLKRVPRKVYEVSVYEKRRGRLIARALHWKSEDSDAFAEIYEGQGYFIERTTFTKNTKIKG